MGTLQRVGGGGIAGRHVRGLGPDQPHRLQGLRQGLGLQEENSDRLARPAQGT